MAWPAKDAVWPVSAEKAQDPVTDALPDTLSVLAARVVTFMVPDTLPEDPVSALAVRVPPKVAVPATARVDASDTAPDAVAGPFTTTDCPDSVTAPFDACSSTPTGLL